MYDVVALGESLIDLTQAGKNELGIELFARNPGGAPVNCLAMNSKLGGKTAFIGMVGVDAFGHYLAGNMEENGIDTEGLIFSREYPTTLSVVTLDSKGEKTCDFYRNPSADMMLSWDMVDTSIIDDCCIFHFGGVSLTGGPCKEATEKAAEYARDREKLVSYDPNYREALWHDKNKARDALLKAVALCDILKVNDDELLLMTGTSDPEAGGNTLLRLGPAVVLVTLGAKGAYFVNRKSSGYVPSFNVKVRDTTGAGDAFTGAFHSRIRGMNRDDIADLCEGELYKIVSFACAAGSLTTTKLGAIPALPCEKEIEDLLGDK